MKCKICGKERLIIGGKCRDCSIKKLDINLLKFLLKIIYKFPFVKKYPSDLKFKSGKMVHKVKSLSGIDFVREKVRIRDGHSCKLCGYLWTQGERRLDVHHLDEKMESKKDYRYDRDNMDKMITLCHKCHLNLPHIRKKLSIKKTINPTLFKTLCTK